MSQSSAFADIRFKLSPLNLLHSRQQDQQNRGTRVLPSLEKLEFSSQLDPQDRRPGQLAFGQLGLGKATNELTTGKWLHFGI